MAIFIGGPAALFWMWITAFLGMTTKFVEVSLSHAYREKNKSGEISGGPMIYMEKGLNMKWLGMIFAFSLLISTFGSGNMPQIDNISSTIESSFGIDPLITSIVMSLLVGSCNHRRNKKNINNCSFNSSINGFYIFHWRIERFNF